jgi:hypothetical protein
VGRRNSFFDAWRRSLMSRTLPVDTRSRRVMQPPAPRTTGMKPEEFRRHGDRLIDWLADYHESLA